ncbi:peptidyl-prolyl cis-trans isomerase [Litorimonas sp. WD9-15]|uniref:peptidylprolyl isomerase n=1 Tax=Litorimonas sp. WD9-15 TaxID=3418716 RepID=UPI003D04B006
MKRFLREPFVHFVLLGALLFAGHSLWQRHVQKADHTLIVSAAEMERQAQIFATENRRQPTDADLEALLFAYVEEQVLMREARRLGLDADDTIIRRRLAQKMRFMIDDVGAPPLPPVDNLKAWFAENPEKFIRPETRSFEHIYFSPRDRSDTVVQVATDALSAGIPTGWEGQGDAFMTGRIFTRQSQDSVRRDFGTAFAEKLFDLPETDDWQGPINSAFGVHLVRLTNITPERLPDFKTIQPEIERVWLDAAKREENAEALKSLMRKYKVEVEE